MKLLLLISALVFVSFEVIAGELWDYSEPVQYLENHDVDMVWLAGGRKLKVKYSNISWEEVETWKKGKALLLGYRAETGPVLLDAVSGKWIPILSGLDRHPIDQLLEKCIEADETTVGMVMCAEEAHQRWDKELNRVYTILMQQIGGAQKRVLREAQRQWIVFRDKETEFITKFYSEQGSIFRVFAANDIMALTKSRVERLLYYYGGPL